MELEHAFQQSEFLVAFELLIIGSVLAPGVIGDDELFQRFIRVAVGYVVSFGPVAVLIYVLYRVSQIS